MDWKGIFEKTIVAIIAGSILGIAGWLLSPLLSGDPQIISAESDWVEVAPTFPPDLYTQKTRSVDAAMKEAFGLQGVESAIAKLRFNGKIRIGTIKLTNPSKVKSKEIELSSGSGLLLSGSSLDSPGEIRSAIKLRPIEPGVSVSLYFVAPGWFRTSDFPVKALHDNRLIEIRQLKVPDEFDFYVRAVVDYPMVVAAFSGIGVLVIVIFFIALIAQALIKDRVAYDAKNIQKQAVSHQRKVLALVQEKYPDKWAPDP